MEIFEWVLIISFAIVFGIWLWTKKLTRDIDKMHVEIKQLIGKIIFMRLEKHGDVIYAYNAFNDEFVCQGKDVEDLSLQFGKRYPDKKGVIVRPDEEKVDDVHSIQNSSSRQ